MIFNSHIKSNSTKVTLLILTFFITLLACQVKAKQLMFSKKKVDTGYQFNYQWLDFAKQKQSFSFVLTEQALFDRFRNLKVFQQSYANKSIARRIKKHFRQNPIAGVNLNYQQNNDDFQIKATGPDQKKVAKAYAEIVKVQAETTKNYYHENYYQLFTNHDRITGVKVDHVQIANGSVADLKNLKPTILDSLQLKNIRTATNYVLSFVQSIPYNTLESRITSSGAGFSAPSRLLWENQGDCDSKMTLTAALLRALMPRIRMVLVYIDGHAFIGIEIPVEKGEVSIAYEGINYVLAEPTGPALLPLGKLAPESELAINQGHYTTENYHAVFNSQEAVDSPWH